MTTSSPTPDNALLDLVRGADPLDDHGELMTAEAAEAMLWQILAEPRPEAHSSARPGARLAVRVAAVGAASAVAVAAAAALTGDDRGGVTPASAAVIRHAMAALDQPPDTILHVDMSAVQDNGDGTTVSWHDESWQQDAAPYSRRQVATDSHGTTESANVGDTEQVYDPATNTIYASTVTRASSAKHQHGYRLSPGPRPGTYVLHLTLFRITPHHHFKLVSGPRESLVITALQARALKNGTDMVKVSRHQPPGAGISRRYRFSVVPAPTGARAPDTSQDSADPSSPDFAGQIRALLQSGGAHVVGHATVHGRDTLEISSQDGHTTYYVDPDTYAPVELDTTGTDGGTSLYFSSYEFLADNAANQALLSLSAQHPSATVDRNQADYVAAEQRLFPNG
ncbi:MAG: hypothetical protein ACTHNU_08595 [Gaiellales bacterium]